MNKATLSATKLRNQLHNLRPNLIVNLKNVRVNGVLFGCSGFIADPDTLRMVYVNTDHNGLFHERALYRVAAHDKDFTGGVNRWSTYAGLAADVVMFLENTPNGHFR